jgi:hypothetical protein
MKKRKTKKTKNASAAGANPRRRATGDALSMHTEDAMLDKVNTWQIIAHC